jgi:hypothetical protein
MVQDFLEKLSNELSVAAPKRKEKNGFSFFLNENVTVHLQDLEPGVSMQATLIPCPERKREDLFIYLMRANLLGQGTGLARIGLDVEEKTLTLLLGLPYEINYPFFKETFEDFVNNLIFWRTEIDRFTNEKTIY